MNPIVDSASPASTNCTTAQASTGVITQNDGIVAACCSSIRSDWTYGVDSSVAAATAAIVATRPMNDPRRVLAVLSDALQRRTTTYDDLMRAHVRATPRNALLVDDALEQLGARVRSVAENDFRLLSEASEILPPARYNWLLRLPGGRTVSPDALYVDAGLVHETNGRRAHEREDLFADMQERHDALTVAGFTVLHNTPHRIRTRGRVVISEVERCYLRLRGNGLPPGVVVLEGAD